MTVVDTTVMIPFLNGSPEFVKKMSEIAKGNGQFAITIITAYEMLKGAYRSSNISGNLNEVK